MTSDESDGNGSADEPRTQVSGPPPAIAEEVNTITISNPVPR